MSERINDGYVILGSGGEANDGVMGDGAEKVGGALLHISEQPERRLRDVGTAPSLGFGERVVTGGPDSGGGFPLPGYRQRELGYDEQGRTVTPLQEHS